MSGVYRIVVPEVVTAVCDNLFFVFYVKDVFVFRGNIPVISVVRRNILHPET